MKKILFALMMTIVGIASIQAQDIKIKWEDDKGREFSITSPGGSFSYGMLPGDRISYDYDGQVIRVGDVTISYDIDGRVDRVGDVTISYDIDGRVRRVGGMTLSYNINGQISRTSGQVRGKRTNPYVSW